MTQGYASKDKGALLQRIDMAIKRVAKNSNSNLTKATYYKAIMPTAFAHQTNDRTIGSNFRGKFRASASKGRGVL